MKRVDVAIVGGGFSGLVTAAHLARQSLRVGIFEPSELGAGAAYSTRLDEHLLNAPAAKMSAFPDDPGHFTRWLEERGAVADGFVSRRHYGQYLAEIGRVLTDEGTVSHVRALVTALARVGSEHRIQTDAGDALLARRVVLATGNLAPDDSFLPENLRSNSRYFGNPWSFSLAGIDGDVLLIGSGLTALDALVALDAAGFAGHVHVVSRHARFPHVHHKVTPYTAAFDLDTSSAKNLVRSFRNAISDASAQGYDWQSVIHALRPHINDLWEQLSIPERARLLRHARSMWEVHRHRAPEPVNAIRERYEREGRLSAHRGRIETVTTSSDAPMRVRIAHAGESHDVAVSCVINCTGPLYDYRRTSDELLRTLMAQGRISPDPLLLGLHIDRDGRAIDASGKPDDDLWIVGPAARSRFYEMTAVPELGRFAQHVASLVAPASELAAS